MSHVSMSRLHYLFGLLLRGWVFSTGLLIYFGLFGSLPTDCLALLAIGAVRIAKPAPLAPANYVAQHIYAANPYFIIAAWQHPDHPEQGEHVAILLRIVTPPARYHDIWFRYRKNHQAVGIMPSRGGFGT